MNMGPWSISDMWAGVGVYPYRMMNFIYDSEARRMIREEDKRIDIAYQDDMRRG